MGGGHRPSARILPDWKPRARGAGLQVQLEASLKEVRRDWKKYSRWEGPFLEHSLSCPCLSSQSFALMSSIAHMEAVLSWRLNC